MRHKISILLLGLVITVLGINTQGAEIKKPSVLFTSGLHSEYFAKPLHAAGIEISVCEAKDLPKLLPSGKFNVVVVTGGMTDPAMVSALNTFLKAGGGVLMYPGSRVSEEDYLERQKFLESYGAHWTMSLIKESDPKQIVSTMFTRLFATETILPPFNDGVTGLLYLEGPNQSGMNSPVSLVTDKNWKPVVKASPNAEAVGWADEKIVSILPYVPEKPEKAPILLALRDVDKGRLAAISIPPEWMFQSTLNCPAVEDMMIRGRDGKPSHWIKLLANLFCWMAEPSLADGKGGATTDPALLNPSNIFKDAALRDWTKAPPIEDQDQLPGIIGARSSYSGGKASVDEWVKAAKEAGLSYLVFLEPLDSTSDENFKKLKADCARLSDESFYACPGIWGRDVYTKTSMFAYGDNVQYPNAELLTADRKFFNNTEGLPKTTRTKYIFDYAFEQLSYKGQFGYFRHNENTIPVWEYKMNHVFPIYSTDNGKKVDDNFDDFAFLQAQNFCYHPASFSLIDDPSQIKRVLKEDWITVNTAPGEFGDGTYTKEYGKGGNAIKMLFNEQLAWLRPFQYVTQGPRIDCWRGRWEITIPSGEWYRPDLWRYQARLHVTSDVGIKQIEIISLGKVLYRFLPNGAKNFDRTFEFENSQQRAIYPVITDVNGKKAIGSYLRNANTLWNEFICGDRCNFLSYGILRTKSGQGLAIKASMNGVTHNKGFWEGLITPSNTLTLNYPTMPIDGQPGGKKTPDFHMMPYIATPGFPQGSEMDCKPLWVASGPDVMIGGGDLSNIIADPSSMGNAWGYWSPVKPNEFITGYGLNTAWVPWPEGIRAGTYEFHLKAAKDMKIADKNRLPVTFTFTTFTELRNSEGNVIKATDDENIEIGPFKKGAYILMDEVGGPAAIVSMDDNLVYRRLGRNVSIGMDVPNDLIAMGTPINCKIGYLGSPSGTDLQVLRNYFKVMSGNLQVGIKEGSAIGDGLAAHIDGKGKGVDISFEPLGINAVLPVMLENMQNNWDVWLVDRTLKGPNWRQVVKVDTTAYAALACDEKKDYFLGHPIVADNTDLVINLCNLLPGQWQLSLHNPTDKPITTKARSVDNWPVFKLAEKEYTIPAGSSVDIEIKTP